MKILAVEIEKEAADWTNTHRILKAEAKRVYELYLDGALREIYFNEMNCAVLILECEGAKAAKNLLQQFPLVKAGLISFEVTELRPYTGLDRLIPK